MKKAASIVLLCIMQMLCIQNDDCFIYFFIVIMGIPHSSQQAALVRNRIKNQPLVKHQQWCHSWIFKVCILGKKCRLYYYLLSAKANY